MICYGSRNTQYIVCPRERPAHAPGTYVTMRCRWRRTRCSWSDLVRIRRLLVRTQLMIEEITASTRWTLQAVHATNLTFVRMLMKYHH